MICCALCSAKARARPCCAMLCVAICSARLWLRVAMLCDAMLRYAMLREGLGCAVALALAVQAYGRTHSHSYRTGHSHRFLDGLLCDAMGCYILC